jgi:hypothetical protein
MPRPGDFDRRRPFELIEPQRRSSGLVDLVVLPHRIELWTSPLPRECSTTELRQQEGRRLPRPKARGNCHKGSHGARKVPELRTSPRGLVAGRPGRHPANAPPFRWMPPDAAGPLPVLPRRPVRASVGLLALPCPVSSPQNTDHDTSTVRSGSGAARGGAANEPCAAQGPIASAPSRRVATGPSAGARGDTINGVRRLG